MKRWAQRIRRSFARAGGETPPATVPAPAAAPEPETPQTTAEIFTVFEERVTPLLAALKSLPPDGEGMEFFTRIDVVRPDDYPDRPDIEPRIDVWVFHTREGKPAGKLHDAPSSHLISIESKWSTPERQDFSQLLALGETPVLRLSFKPDAEPAARLSSHVYIERYEKPRAGIDYGIYCGGYGMVIEKSAEKIHTRIEDFVSVIENWLQTHAPQRLPEASRLIAPPRDIDILPPINIRKRGPQQ